MSKLCKWCWLEFSPIRDRQSFCSRSCGASHSAEVRRQNPRTLACVACGVPYQAYGNRSKACSVSCSRWSRRQQNKGKVRVR